MENTKDKVCLHCGCDIQDNKYGNKKYCSDSCRKKSYYKHKICDKVCTVCKKPFKGRIGQKVCSDKCSLKAQQNTRKTCPICGKRFNARGNGLYCSDKCYRTANSKTKGLMNTTCRVCGKPFRTKITSPELTCSNECSALLIPTFIDKSLMKIFNTTDRQEIRRRVNHDQEAV